MATLADLKGMVLRILGDTVDGTASPVAGKTYRDAQLLLEGINFGIDAILPWISKTSVATITGDGTTVEFTLPTDFYRVDGVLDLVEKKFLGSASISPGLSWKDTSVIDMTFLEMDNKIVFSRAPSTTGLELYYAARWNQLVNDTDVTNVPAIALIGVALFAASYVVLPSAAQASDVRQWLSKTDSGTPVMNPRLDLSMHLLKRFETEMSRIPARPRGQVWA